MDGLGNLGFWLLLNSERRGIGLSLQLQAQRPELILDDSSCSCYADMCSICLPQCQQKRRVEPIMQIHQMRSVREVVDISSLCACSPCVRHLSIAPLKHSDPDLVATSSRSRVDASRAMCHNFSDHSSLLEICERLPCERAIDLESVDQHGGCDETV